MATFDCGGTSVSGPSATITGWGSGKASVTYTDESGKQSYRSIDLNNPTESERSLLTAAGYYTTDSKGNVHESVTGLSAVRGQQISIIPTGTETGSSKPTYEVNPAYSVQSAVVTGWNGDSVSVKTTDAFGREKYRTINTKNATGQDAAILSAIENAGQGKINPNGGNATLFSSVKGQNIGYINPTTTSLSTVSNQPANSQPSTTQQTTTKTNVGPVEKYYTKTENGVLYSVGKDANGNVVSTTPITNVKQEGGQIKYQNPTTGKWCIAQDGTKTQNTVTSMLNNQYNANTQSVNAGAQATKYYTTTKDGVLYSVGKDANGNVVSETPVTNVKQQDGKTMYQNPTTGKWYATQDGSKTQATVNNMLNNQPATAEKYYTSTKNGVLYSIGKDANGNVVSEVPITNVRDDDKGRTYYQNPVTGTWHQTKGGTKTQATVEKMLGIEDVSAGAPVGGDGVSLDGGTEKTFGIADINSSRPTDKTNTTQRHVIKDGISQGKDGKYYLNVDGKQQEVFLKAKEGMDGVFLYVDKDGNYILNAAGKRCGVKEPVGSDKYNEYKEYSETGLKRKADGNITEAKDGKLYGEFNGQKEQIYLEEDPNNKGYFYYVDGNGNYIYNDNDTRRHFKSDDPKYQTYEKTGNMYEKKLHKDEQNGVYYYQYIDKDGKEFGDRQYLDNATMISDDGQYARYNVVDSDGKTRTIKVPSKYVETFENNVNAVGTYEANGGNFNDIAAHIDHIDGQNFVLTNDVTMSVNSNPDDLLQASAKGGSGNTTNPNYESKPTNTKYDSNTKYISYGDGSAKDIETNQIRTGTGTSSGYWNGLPQYKIVSGNSDHYAADHTLSEKELNLLLYFCSHEAGSNHSPAQDSAIASAILNGWENQINGSAKLTFSEYVSKACVQHCTDKIKYKEQAVKSGNYDVYDGTWEISNGNDTRRINDQMIDTVTTLLTNGERTTDACQWVAGKGENSGYNVFTHADWNKMF